MTALPEKLLPCPFCGSDDVELKPDLDGSGYVECSGCLTTTPEEFWQRRTPDSRLLAAHEALRDVTDALANAIAGKAVRNCDEIILRANNTITALTAPGDDARRELEEDAGGYYSRIDRDIRALVSLGKVESAKALLTEALTRLTGKPEGDEKETSNG